MNSYEIKIMLLKYLQLANGLFSNKGEVARIRLLQELVVSLQNDNIETNIDEVYSDGLTEVGKSYDNMYDGESSGNTKDAIKKDVYST